MDKQAQAKLLNEIVSQLKGGSIDKAAAVQRIMSEMSVTDLIANSLLSG